MLYYYLKRRKYAESKSPKVAKTTKGKCFYQNVQCGIVKKIHLQRQGSLWVTK